MNVCACEANIKESLTKFSSAVGLCKGSDSETTAVADAANPSQLLIELTIRDLSLLMTLPFHFSPSKLITQMHACVCVCAFPPQDIWSEQSFQTDPDLPPGWKKITDMAGIYYWHIPTGATQWERPATHPAPSGHAELQALADHTASTPRKHSVGSISPSPTPDHEVRARYTHVLGLVQ